MNEIAVGDTGRFYPDTPDNAIFDVKVEAIDSANIAQLQQRDFYVASTYQGDLPVKMNRQQKMIPQEATYYIYLSIN